MRKSPAAVSSALVLRPRPEMMKMVMMAGSLMLYCACMYPPVAPSFGTAAAKPMAIPSPIMNLFVGRTKEEEEEVQFRGRSAAVPAGDARAPATEERPILKAWRTCCSPLIQSEEVDLVSYAADCPHLLLCVPHIAAAVACRCCPSCWCAIRADGCLLLLVRCRRDPLLRVLRCSLLLLGGSHSALPPPLPRRGRGVAAVLPAAACLASLAAGCAFVSCRKGVAGIDTVYVLVSYDGCGNGQSSNPLKNAVPCS